MIANPGSPLQENAQPTPLGRKNVPSDEVVIDVHGLTKKFGDRVVVDHIDLTVKKGMVYGFLGSNGSGKTTTLRMLTGLLTPSGGSGTCLGYDILKDSVKIKSMVGYMSQKFSLYGDLTVTENLSFVANLYQMSNSRDVVNKKIEEMGLGVYRHHLANSLSGGWKQRLALAACTMPKPKLLLLDEPTAGVDPKARRDFWGEIHRMAGEGLTVLVTTHYMDEAEQCFEIAYIFNGRILTRGTVTDVINRAGIYVYHVSSRSYKNLYDLANQLQALESIDNVVPFGLSLHIVSSNKAKMADQLKPFFGDSDLVWEEAKPILDDVFIFLMGNNAKGMKHD